MPGKNGLLTEEERRIVTQWIERHPSCSACGTKMGWTMDECLRAVPPDPRAASGGLFLCVALVCQCGNSVLLHAQTVGIV